MGIHSCPLSSTTDYTKPNLRNHLSQTITTTIAMLRIVTARAAPRTATLAAAQQIRHYAPKSKDNDSKVTYEKGHELDVQSQASKQAMHERSSAGGSEKGVKKDPKEGHPKAP